MPSDELIRKALAATQSAREDFLSSVKTTADQVESYLRSRKADRRDVSGRMAEELGSFAAGRIDASKFAAFAPSEGEAPGNVLEAMERAAAVLREVARFGDDAFVATAEPAETVADAVDRVLSNLGRAFGAAELVEIVRSGRFPNVEADRRLQRYGPDDWRPREREVAPPVVVSAEGQSLRGARLRDWLEGRQQILILAEGRCPPAPMTPLAGPGALVGQLHDAGELEVLNGFEGPVALAVVPDVAAAWVHDPRRTPVLEVRHMPAAADLAPVGPISVWRQQQDLEQLRALTGVGAGLAVAATNGNGSPQEAAPADRLAAWLLKQADLGVSE